jgi:membrane associated rhomboid family serine protease
MFVIIHFVMKWNSTSEVDEQLLLHWGASIGPRTTNGEWWRLATAMFVHWGWLHVIVEAAGLVMAGLLVERLVGPAAFALVYVASGLLAALWGLTAHPVSMSAGAAGAIFGIYGLLLATLVWGLVQRSTVTVPLAVLKRLCPGGVVFLVYNMATEGFLSESMESGLVVGFLSGSILAARISTDKPPMRRIWATMAATIGIVVALAAPLRGMADVTAEVGRVIENEERTAAAYVQQVERFKKGRLTAEALATIANDIGTEIHATRMTLAILTHVPEEQQQVLADASEYLRLREDSWRLRVEGLRSGRMPTLQRAERLESDALTAFEKVEKWKGEKVEK